MCHLLHPVFAKTGAAILTVDSMRRGRRHEPASNLTIRKGIRYDPLVRAPFVSRGPFLLFAYVCSVS